MAQRQWRSDDTSKWKDGFGTGSDGDATITGFESTDGYGLATFTGTSGNTYGTFTDGAYFNGGNGGRVGDIVLIHQTRGTGAGNWELNKIVSRVGSTLNLAYALQNTYITGCQVISSGHHDNLTIGNTTVAAWNGLIGGIVFAIAKGTTTITGTITGTGKGFSGGPLTSYINGSNSLCGEGTVGDHVRQREANGNGAGGGNQDAGRVGGGGGGGNGAAGTNGGDTTDGNEYGYGGTAVGNVGLTSFDLGGGGGCGGQTDYGASGVGSAGGGGIFIFAKNIVITGAITLGGVAGTAAQTGGGYVDAGGGGGGAGGSCLLKCETATLGTAKITAAAGSGGGGTENGGAGGAGSVGRVHIDYSDSYTGTTTPTINATLDKTITVNTGNFLAFF